MKLKQIVVFFILFIPLNASDRLPVVMIDPPGHAGKVCRKLIGEYERGEAYKFAEAIKKTLQEGCSVRPIISRSLGEEVLDLQIASFSNRLGSDFFLRIHLYRDDSAKPKIFIYHHVADPVGDFARRSFNPLEFIPVERAHLRNIYRSRAYAEKIKKELDQEQYKRYLECYGVYGIPLRQMIGIIAPAVLIEVGICEDDKWRGLVQPITESLKFLSDLGEK